MQNSQQFNLSGVHMWFIEYYKSQMESRYRKKLKNKQFTILTGSCIGGVIYNHLGLRFNSPTINMWFTPHDVIKLCSDLDYYMGCDLIFDVEPHGDCPNSPAARLGEEERAISLYFNHYHSEDEAREKWESRKKRIIKDCIYVITTDYQLDNEDILKLKQMDCCRYVVFTSRKRDDIPNSFYIKSLKKCNDSDLHMVTMNEITGMRTWEHEFDYVKWLNGKSSYRKHTVWNLLAGFL